MILATIGGSLNVDRSFATGLESFDLSVDLSITRNTGPVGEAQPTSQ